MDTPGLDLLALVCGYRTASKSRRRGHYKYPTARPYRCTLCEYAAFKKCNLIVHFRTHSTARPYKCNECAYTTKTKNSLDVHQHGHRHRVSKIVVDDVCFYQSATAFRSRSV